MDQILVSAKKLLEENPAITSEEMFHRLHLSGYGVNRTIFAVYSILQVDLDELCKAAIAEYKQPLVTKSALHHAFIACDFASEDIDHVISQKYPKDVSRYAVALSGSSYRPLTARNPVYNIGCGDFTVEAWVKPGNRNGTILSRKPTAGGSYNGGFLLVLKPDGTIKLATDDGMGFYEVNSEPVAVCDGAYHHILGLRQGKALKIYVDFKEIHTTPRTNRHPGLNIDNTLGITVGAVEQRQEPYNHFNGCIGECRLWKKAKTYSSKEDWANTDYISPDLIGMWGFWGKSGTDYSETNNPLNITGIQFESWKL